MLNEFTLILPGLLSPWPENADILSELRYLPKIVKKAQWQEKSDYYGEALFDYFSLPSASQAAILALSEGLPTEQGFWATLDPLCVQMDMNTAYLANHAKYYLSAEELKDLFECVQNFLAQDGYKLYRGKEETWYLQSDKFIPLDSIPWQSLMGKPLTTHLLKSKTSYWNNLQAELQMLLFNHEHNMKRRYQGSMTCDTLWFSNSAELPKKQSTPYKHIWTDDHLTQALGTFTETSITPINWSEFSFEPKSMQDSLLLSSTMLLKNIQETDYSAFKHKLEVLDQKVFKLLFQLLKKKDLKQLNCYVAYMGSAQKSFSLTSKALASWFFF